MPQKDRWRSRTVDIDCKFNETLDNLPQPGKLSAVLITAGYARCVLNGKSVKINFPAVLCLSDKDSITIIEKQNFAAQSVSFPSDFFVSAENRPADIPTGISVFERSENNSGLFCLDRMSYSKIWQWFFIMGAEVHAQSDSLWVCRVKKFLLQILAILSDLCRRHKSDPLNLALDYIYANYYKKISLDELCRQARTNRVYLNKGFKEQYGCTAIEYLNRYRLKMAEKILTYTRMSLAEVAAATGFEYDTYFIRRFTKYKGMSPTDFRKIAHRAITGGHEIIL